MSNYHRVIPRDFFNEAKLLKCMGQLSLKIHDGVFPEGISLSITENGQPFFIDRNYDDSGLCVLNYRVELNGREVICSSPYNSKRNYPFYCHYPGEEEIEVFDDKGEFSTDFIDYFKKK
jgi:hypothetical protein